MRTYGCISAALLAVFFAGCNQIAEPVPETDSELVFHARWAESPDTRTALQDDGTSIWWTLSEKINVFYGNKFSGVFVSTNETPSALASFQGTLTVVTGTIENGNASQAYWAVYPYSTDNSCDGESVTLTVPAEQNAVEGSFADKFFPAVAKSHSVDLAFYNVCGGVRFSVFNEGIESVSFKANGGEPLVGKVQVGFGPDDLPVVKGIADGKDEVTVSAPVGGFVPGRSYFAAFLPQTLSQGLSMTFKKANGTATYVKENALTVNRSRFGTLDEKDKDLSFSGGTTPDPSGIIVFADGNLKSLLVAAFDTNGDQELSYAEAAAVTSFGNVLDDYCEAVSFDEFQYFTGITSIRASQFEDWDRMTSILLPESITRIGQSAFRDCSSLLSLAIPENVTEIGSQAFMGCSSIRKLTIGKCFANYTLPDLGFRSSTDSLSEVILLPGITEVNRQAFSHWSALKSVVIPDTVIKIRESAFSYCTGLESIVLPDSITSLGDNAFAYCSGLLEITLPPRIESISKDLFRSCTSLQSIEIPHNVTTVSHSAFRDCDHLTSILIPDSVTYIGPYCFSGTALTHIHLPNHLRSIDDYTFDGCSSLQSVDLPEGMTGIGRYAFHDCIGLESIVFPEGFASIMDSAFYGCTSLKDVLLPHLTELGDFAFAHCTSLESIVIPENISYYLGMGVFEYCTSLASITLPSDMETIPNYFFDGCAQLKDVTIPKGIRQIGEWAFAGSGVVSVDFPSTLIRIQDSAFGRCHALTSVSIKEGLLSISDNVFRECTSLVSITLPQSLTYIGELSFAECTALSKVILTPIDPPNISIEEKASFFGSDLSMFYVPADAVETYKTHYRWQNYADRIFPVTALE